MCSRDATLPSHAVTELAAVLSWPMFLVQACLQCRMQGGPVTDEVCSMGIAHNLGILAVVESACSRQCLHTGYRTGT